MTATQRGIADASLRTVPTADRRSDLPVGRGARGKALVPYAVGIAATALVIAGFGFGVHVPNLHNGLLAAAFTAVGMSVVQRRPGHHEGLLFVATGAAHAVMFFGRQVGLDAGPGDLTQRWVVWATWLGVWPLPLVLALVGVTIMSFPEGRLPSSRWRLTAAAVVGLAAVAAAVSALWPVDYARNELAVAHPLGLGGERAAEWLWSLVGPPSLLLAQLAWVACVVVRLRRARGDEARQLKWFVYGVAMAAVAMIAGLVAFGSPALGVLAAPIMPVAAGAAILKYRLYDIDLVINKTLVVGMMAAIVTAGYVAVVVGSGASLGARRARVWRCRSWPRPSSLSPSTRLVVACSAASTGWSTAPARLRTRPWRGCRPTSAVHPFVPDVSTCSRAWRRRSRRGLGRRR